MDPVEKSKGDVQVEYSSSDEDVDFPMEVAEESVNPTYEVLSFEEVVQHMAEITNRVNSVLELPISVTRTLLKYFHWDQERLMDRFYGGEQDLLFEEARIVNPFNAQNSDENSITETLENDVCTICFSLFRCSDMTGLDCGHRFCTGCWRVYLTSKIIGEGVGQNISCPEHACEILVDECTVMKLIEDPDVKSRYQQLIVNGFVESNRLLKWCPSPGCNNIIKTYSVDTMEQIVCKCNYSFCFSCGEEWHDPINCRLLKEWIKKSGDNKETNNWIVRNTKQCPGCDLIIEKNGGCNHMICKNEHCRAEFCWLCLGPWDLHGYTWFHCNRYSNNLRQIAIAASTSEEKADSDFQQYLFYCGRYISHRASLKYEEKMRKLIKDITNHINCSNDIQFFKRAVDVLCDCRQTLTFTYVFAYYVKKNKQTDIFENHQKGLEDAIENLSSSLETEISHETFQIMRNRILEQCEYCEARKKLLLDHVHDGNERDWWQYNI